MVSIQCPFSPFCPSLIYISHEKPNYWYVIDLFAVKQLGHLVHKAVHIKQYSFEWGENPYGRWTPDLSNHIGHMH